MATSLHILETLEAAARFRPAIAVGNRADGAEMQELDVLGLTLDEGATKIGRNEGRRQKAPRCRQGAVLSRIRIAMDRAVNCVTTRVRVLPLKFVLPVVGAGLSL